MTKTTFPFLAMVSVAALTACAGGRDRPVDPEQRPVTKVSVAPTTGLSSEQEAGVYARLARLEADVSGMKVQMSQLGPILEKMPALQDKLGELVAELQRIDARVAAAQAHVDQLPVATSGTLRGGPEMPAVKPAPAKGLVTTTPPLVSVTATPGAKPPIPKIIPQKADEPLPAVKPAASVPVPVSNPVTSSVQVEGQKALLPTTLTAASGTAPASVQQVRVGDYPDKTRIVFDVSRKVPFVYDLDNAERILILDLDAGAFTAAAGANFANSPLVASYTAQAVAGGKYRVILQLREEVSVLGTQVLPPNGEKGDRIVLDLAKAK